MSIADGPMAKIEEKKAMTLLLAQNYARKMESEAKQGVLWKDQLGHARQGIHAGVERSRDEINIYLAHGMEYGEHLEKGTKPHVIRPRKKKGLYWGVQKAPNKPLIVKEVKHPGTKAYPIIAPTVDRNYPEIKETVKEIWS